MSDKILSRRRNKFLIKFPDHTMKFVAATCCCDLLHLFQPYDEGRQNRKHCFLPTFGDGGQKRKHCFVDMFPEGGQTRKHCFLAIFPEGGQTRKHNG